MIPYEFDLVLGGLDLDRDAQLLDAFDRRVADFTFASNGGVVRAAVERRAGSFAEAIRTAIQDAESIPGVTVLRVEPDAHVSQTEIASRLGRSRQSVSQLVSGARGPGGFPEPAVRSGHVMLWRWTDVAEWARRAGLGVHGPDRPHAAVVQAANALLEARRAMAAVDAAARERLAGILARWGERRAFTLPHEVTPPGR